MKNLILIFVFTLLATGLWAQKEVNKAKMAFDKGELDAAKEQIDLAVENPKANTKAKTWYYKGIIYGAIATSEDTTYKALADEQEALTQAVEAYQKAMELEDNENSTYYVFSSQETISLWGVYITKGAEAYEAGDYEKARIDFERTISIMPADTTGYLYAGISAQNSDQPGKAMEHYYKCIEMGYQSPDIWNSLIYLERNSNEDMEKALDLTLQAREKFPDNQDFAKEEIQLLLNMDRLDEAKNKLENAIKEEPENMALILNLAVLNDNAHKALVENEAEEAKIYEAFESATESYKRALEVEPDNLVANYNLAAMYNEKANIYYRQVQDMDIKEYQKSGKEVAAKGNEFIQQALPYMEKAYELAPDDIDTVSALQIFYTKLKMNDKAEEMSNRLDELEGDN